MSDSERQSRAEARKARMTISRDEANDPVPLSGAAAVSLAARMSKEQWLLAKKTIPAYSRADMPIVFRPASPE